MFLEDVGSQCFLFFSQSVIPPILPPTLSYIGFAVIIRFVLDYSLLQSDIPVLDGPVVNTDADLRPPQVIARG